MNLLPLPRRQDLPHLEHHRHPRLPEPGARLLELIDLSEDLPLVGPLVRDEERKERVEIVLLPLDVGFEIGERLLVSGEDVLERPDLVVGQLKLVAHLRFLPELSVMHSAVRKARPAEGGSPRGREHQREAHHTYLRAPHFVGPVAHCHPTRRPVRPRSRWTRPPRCERIEVVWILVEDVVDLAQ